MVVVDELILLQKIKSGPLNTQFGKDIYQKSRLYYFFSSFLKHNCIRQSLDSQSGKQRTLSSDLVSWLWLWLWLWLRQKWTLQTLNPRPHTLCLEVSIFLLDVFFSLLNLSSHITYELLNLSYIKLLINIIVSK